MNKKNYILTFASDMGFSLYDRQSLNIILDEGDELYVLDGNIGFIKTKQSLKALQERLMTSSIKGGPFVITQIHNASSSGVMPSDFWNYLIKREIVTVT